MKSLFIVMCLICNVAFASIEIPEDAFQKEPQVQRLYMTREQVAKAGDSGLVCSAYYRVKSQESRLKGNTVEADSYMERSDIALGAAFFFGGSLDIPDDTIEDQYWTNVVPKVESRLKILEKEQILETEERCDDYVELIRSMVLPEKQP